MKKEKIKEKIGLPSGKPKFLSAQDFKLFSLEDKQVLRDVLTEAGCDPDEYEEKMKALFPKKFEPKPLVWRNK